MVQGIIYRKPAPIAPCGEGRAGERNEHKMHCARIGAGSCAGLRRAGKPFRLRGRIDSPFPHGLKVSIFLGVEGAAHYLPSYAGNLDIMTSAALATAEQLAVTKLAVAA